MIEVEETDDGLFVSDAAKNELHLELRDWVPGGDPDTLYREVDYATAGRVSELRFPSAAVTILTEGRDRWRAFLTEKGPRTYEAGTHQLKVSANLFVYLRFHSRFTLRRDPTADTIALTFPDRCRVTIGFRGHERRPTATITVTKDPANLAKAVPYLSSALETTSPDRSYPSLRAYPPRLALGEEFAVPDTVRAATERTGIELVVPSTFAAVFVTAPLAYYLQATLRTADREDGLLRLPGRDRDIILRPLPAMEHDVAALLERVFWLDCLVRNGGPFGIDMAETRLLDAVGIDAERTYTMAPPARLAAYLTVSFDDIADDLPPWHLSMFVAPAPESVPALPHILDRLGLVVRPQSQPVHRRDLLDRAIDDRYPSSRGPEPEKAVPTIEPRAPAAAPGRFHGWIAPGFPVGVFKATPASFDHRLETADPSDGRKSVTIVLNDPEMAAERSSVSDIYRKRSTALSIDITIHDALTCHELATRIEQPTDFLHFIGHCTESGLQCPDGDLSVTTVDTSNARTFLLNACGSYEQGLELLAKGSVGGVVTRNAVLDRDATRIGGEFARLVMHGFNLEHALAIARTRSLTGFEYSVLGDGTFRLSQPDEPDPVVMTIEPINDDRFRMTAEVAPIRDIGRCHQSYYSADDQVRLTGNPDRFELDRAAMVTYLEDVNQPVTFDGTYYWSDELAIKLRS